MKRDLTPFFDSPIYQTCLHYSTLISSFLFFPYNLSMECKKRILCLFAYVVLACLFVWWLKPYYLFSILIVLGPPSLINFLWLRQSRRKILVFSLLSTLLFAPSVELASRLSNVWDVQSILPRPFGEIPLENIFFAFINFFWVLSFYEYFVDKDSASAISRRFKYLVGLYCLTLVISHLVYFYNSDLLAMNYFQVAVLVLIAPSLIIFGKKPGLLKKVILPTAFFAVVFFIYEIISLKIGSWWWPGEYLFALNFDGQVFPLDDVIIWYLLSTTTLIGGYEFFTDDWA